METSSSGRDDLMDIKSKIERERALHENVKYDESIKLGIAKEQSQKGAAMLEKASGPDPLPETLLPEVRRLKLETEKLKARIPRKF